MYDIDERQFILRQSTGDIYNFYYDKRFGICYSSLSRRNSWTNPTLLHKGVHSSFFADMDTEDHFHLLFQDSQGNINYTYLDKDNVRTIPILNSKTPSTYNKYLQVIPTKNHVHFFYILHRENSSILAHQILFEGSIGNPRVIDYVTETKKPFSILLDNAKNIFVFYHSSDGKYLQLGYKRHNSVKKTWGEFVPVTKYQGNCEHSEMVTDIYGTFHLCYQRQTQKQYELVYLQKSPDSNKWSNETILHSSSHTYENASLFWVNENIIVYWLRDDIIYYCLGSQSGNAWENPAKYSFSASSKPACLSYKTNYVYEADKIAVKTIPGSVVGGLKFAFYQIPSDNGENLSAEELRNLILESLKLLKDGLQTLKEDQSTFRDELNRCISRQEDLEKELVKYSVKLEIIETQAGNTKSISKRLESLSADINSIKAKLDSSS